MTHRPSLAACWLLLASSCTSAPAPTATPRQEPTATSAPRPVSTVPKHAVATPSAAPIATPAAPEKQSCAAAVALAVQQQTAQGERVRPSDFEARQAPRFGEGDFDFDRDGRADCVLTFGARTQLLFLSPSPKRSGFQFVGEVIADCELEEIHCGSQSTNGLCDVSGSEQMIHGETQIRTYAFDGESYRQVSVRLTEPHPKFGP